MGVESRNKVKLRRGPDGSRSRAESFSSSDVLPKKGVFLFPKRFLDP